MGRKNTNPARQRLKCRHCNERWCHNGKTICHECNKLHKVTKERPPRINSIIAMSADEYETMQEPHVYREGRLVREDSLW